VDNDIDYCLCYWWYTMGNDIYIVFVTGVTLWTMILIIVSASAVTL